MQCQYVTPQPDDFSKPELLSTVDHKGEIDLKVGHFQTHFSGCMEMYSDAQTVAEYLDAHEGWFCRCAEPMKTDSLGNNGYILVVGKYGAFGYSIEPKMAVVLEPPTDGIYQMHSIPLDEGDRLGYQVDYRASMKLNEIAIDLATPGIEKAFKNRKTPDSITQVIWELHMDVMVRFPNVISKLPWSLVQTTGDRLLTQIVRQVSPHLTYKVQQDFHSRLGLPLPAKAGRKLEKIEGFNEHNQMLDAPMKGQRSTPTMA
jgi:Protein of unknown function (DUF1997)